MQAGICYSGVYATFDPRMIIVTRSPQFCVTSITGSDIAYDISTGSFLIGDIITGPGGSVWNALKTV